MTTTACPLCAPHPAHDDRIWCGAAKPSVPGEHVLCGCTGGVRAGPDAPAPSRETAMTDLLRFIGWWDRAEQATPTYDPPHDGPCIVCMGALTPDTVRTVSLLDSTVRERSLFYRLHRACHEGLSARESCELDSAVLDAAPRLVHPTPEPAMTITACPSARPTGERDMPALIREEVVAMWLWGSEYAQSGLSAADWWRTLPEHRRRTVQRFMAEYDAAPVRDGAADGR